MTIAHLNKTPRTLPQPTCALPGTAEKIAVLTARYCRGEQLHHPQDNGSRVQMGKVSHGNTNAQEHTGVVVHHLRFRARVWCRRLNVQLDLGLFRTMDQAAAAVLRARKLLV